MARLIRLVSPEVLITVPSYSVPQVASYVFPDVLEQVVVALGELQSVLVFVGHAGARLVVLEEVEELIWNIVEELTNTDGLGLEDLLIVVEELIIITEELLRVE